MSSPTGEISDWLKQNKPDLVTMTWSPNPVCFVMSLMEIR
ncbi:hypothetical protein Lp90_3161 [Lactiplantibacillus plantarum]|uniref:Uncharacterized protein n=1 Tax=Lactiplantibacillus plantarum TaxID=1590 RepID=A0AAW3RDH6_LACPN|nr:hypothetical protein GBLP1_g0024 [Lactiplantibacillus plantarum]KEZ12501.1 hypothetical protein Lp90_3161 [Lactiplantibacillus plantarum]KFL86434.1 hypothetical protein LpDm1_3028 [Lactiplantibacillus plantarum]KZU11732.1 hypothetical protein CNW10_2972 [Lactiplantibacillus plantarum]KZU76062.1 hypothetical protein Nizo2891_2690 [Lactiplantibacillus plantarum]